jgi:hypothetical protein
MVRQCLLRMRRGGETADAIAPLDFIDAGRRPLISRAVIRGLARIGECILLSLLGFAIAYTYVPLSDLQQSSQYQIALLTTALITVLTYDALNLYTVNALSNVSQILSRLMLGWLFATGLLMAGVFFMKIGPEFSRVWLASWFVGGAVMTLVARMIFSIAVRHWVRQGQLQRRAVVYGWGDKTAGLISALQRDVNNDARVLGYFERGATTGVPKSRQQCSILRRPRRADRCRAPHADRHRHSRYSSRRRAAVADDA